MKARSNLDSRVIGLGGVFFRAKSPRRLSSWYRKHLGIKTTNNTALFTWQSSSGSKKPGYTVWAIFPSDTSYFRNAHKQSMINYRVKNLDKVLARLRRERVTVAKKVHDSEYGRFAWARDPEGNWLELWQPPRSASFPEEAMSME